MCPFILALPVSLAVVIYLGFLLSAAGWKTQMQEERKGLPSALFSQKSKPWLNQKCACAKFWVGWASFVLWG